MVPTIPFSVTNATDTAQLQEVMSAVKELVFPRFYSSTLIDNLSYSVILQNCLQDSTLI